jgi:hypothetical protein
LADLTGASVGGSPNRTWLRALIDWTSQHQERISEVIGDTPAQLRARNIVLAEDDLWLHIPLNNGSTPKCAAVALTRMANTRGARPPCALAVAGTEFGYRRPDGVWAVLACGGRELVCLPFRMRAVVVRTAPRTPLFNGLF